MVVVGAGVIGCAVAYELAGRGASIDIIDDRPAGLGATRASAGMLAPFLEARDEGPLLDLTARSLTLFDDFVARVARASGQPIRYQRTGTLDVTLSDEGCRTLGAMREALAARDVAAEWLDKTAVHDREPLLSHDVLGGLLIPTHGYVAAAQLTAALAAAARSYGTAAVHHARVQRIAQSGGDLVVETDRGSWTGSHVVLAGGSWSGHVEIEGVRARVPVTPVRGQLLELRWDGPMLQRVVWAERCYVVPWQDGTVLVGATVEDVGFDERTTLAGIGALMDAVCDIIPRAAAAALTDARAGLRPATPDGLPVIGASTVVPKLFYATGHYRNGILLAPLTAQLVADALVGRPVDPMLESIAPGRFGVL